MGWYLPYLIWSDDLDIPKEQACSNGNKLADIGRLKLNRGKTVGGYRTSKKYTNDVNVKPAFAGALGFLQYS